MKKLLDKLFGVAEEINGRDRCPTYLYRWVMLRGKSFQIYLHHFVGDDWSLDLHDHPKRFISIGLWGGYEELTPCFCGEPDCKQIGSRAFKAPWVRSFPAEHIHRLRLNGKECWTLVVVLKASRPWGFWHDGKFIGWREYVGSELADRMKACD